MLHFKVTVTHLNHENKLMDTEAFDLQEIKKCGAVFICFLNRSS